jgi:hypothetical protein
MQLTTRRASLERSRTATHELQVVGKSLEQNHGQSANHGGLNGKIIQLVSVFQRQSWIVKGSLKPTSEVEGGRNCNTKAAGNRSNMPSSTPLECFWPSNIYTATLAAAGIL